MKYCQNVASSVSDHVFLDHGHKDTAEERYCSEIAVLLTPLIV